MATVAPSPLASSVDKTNGGKLSRLLIDGGTTVLRKVFDRFHPPANLASDLKSCYSTLNNLLRRRILNRHQWDKLFPPGGAAPDSHTFDITLLFLLLNNICGLSPPPSGWHTKPPTSDTSLEANLARIKVFRNVLYGHVSTTAVDTSTFSALWQEITLALTALGLDKAEIGKLKAESGGEEDYLDALFEWVDSEEDIKSQLKNVQQTQSKTQQTVEQVRHTQSKTQQTVEQVRQSQSKTQQTVEQVRQTQSKTQQTVAETQQTVNEVAAGLQQVREAVDSFQEGREKDRTDEVLRNLAKAEFKGDVEHYVERFQADTREWVFSRVEKWLDDRSSPNRVMVISGNAGMGKSVMAAVICQRMQDAGRLSGNHFCQHNNARYRNPQLMLQSLACHLSHALPEYKQALVEQLSRNLGSDLNNMGVEALFALLFKEPLGTLSDPGSNMLVVIDGLDESEYQGRNELLDVIANQFCKLPLWIHFLVTTRPATNITEKLKHLKPFQLEPDDMNNIQDVRIVLQKKLQHVIKAENREDILEKLVLKCEGLMLYAHFLILAIEENPSVLDKDLDDGLPLGISSVYSSYFKRLESELLKEDNVKEENFLNLLCAITASREPLPIDFVSRLLLPGEDSPLAKRRLLKALGTVSSLLPIRNGCLHVIHKSVEDWLTDSSCYGEHDFIVEEKQGHRILASLCTAEFDELKQKGVHNVQFSATEKYALCHSAWHMFYSHKEIRRDRLEELTKAYVTDLELLFAKLCVGSAIAAEDVIWFQKQGISSLLSEDIQSILNTLKHLLRKYHDIFTSHPHLFWQNVLNEGGAVLSGEASNLLQKKYPEIPYMECIHKDSQQGGVLARFQCFEKVVCFDVSSNLDYMVCECGDGVLYLWSLQTARLLWTRPVQVPKGSKFLPFRTLPSSSVRSCYRSVVFHPTEDLVLPGILSHAYTTEGDLKPLFVESSCRFSVCSVSGDKTEVLTNCLDDAKCLRMWSLKNGAEVARITRDEDILSFARSQDGSLLAISHPTGSICLLDVMSDFTILAETTAPEVREMLKFSPDNRVLFCVLIPDGWFLPDICAFHVNATFGEQSRISLIVSSDQVCYDPKKFDFVSDRGFLLGDLIPTSTDIDYFVLDKYTALTTSGERKYCIDMVSTDKVAENSKDVVETSKIALSSDGETVYAVVSRIRFLLTHLRVVAWDVSSGKLIAKKNTGVATNTCLVCVTEGVLLETSDGYLELWRADLSECIRRWTNLSRIRKVIPVSEERVACITEGEVTVLDTTSGNILSRIPALHNVLACNSKLQILTTDGAGTYLLYDGTSVFWKRKLPDFSPFLSDAIFSPTEQFVIIYHQRKGFILDAVLGNTLYTLDLLSPYAMKPLRFISSENYVVVGLSSVRLYNVKFGDLLSEMNIGSGPKRCLAVCPSKRLLAIGVDDRNHRYTVFRVWLPGDKESRKS